MTERSRGTSDGAVAVRLPAVLRYEWMKLRRSRLPTVVALPPVLTIALALVVVLSSPRMRIGTPDQVTELAVMVALNFWAYVVLPTTALLTALEVTGSEHQNGHWPRLLLLPVRRATWVVAKALVVAGALVVSNALLLALIVGSFAAALPEARASMDIPMLLGWTRTLGVVVLGSLAMASVMFVGALLWRASVIAIATLLTGLTSAFAINRPWWTWHPWRWAGDALLDRPPMSAPWMMAKSLVVAGVVIALSSWLVARRDVTRWADEG